MITVDIPFDGKLHETVLKALYARKEMSEQSMTDRQTAWQKSDQDFQAYMPKSENDSSRESERDNSGVPHYVTLEVPYAYATVLTAHTYLTSVFLSRDPVFQFAGRHGESEMSVQALESLMGYQTLVGGHLPPLYIWLMDVLKYGVGVIGNFWEKEENTVSKYFRRPVTVDGFEVPGEFENVKQTRTIKGYEGTRLFNIRPYEWLPDPRVPLVQPHKGEFQGWKTELTWNTIVKRKAQGQYTNVNKVRDIAKTHSQKVTNLYEPNDGTILPVMAGDELFANAEDSLLIGKVPAYEMIVELSPKQWGLGSTEAPEKWMFTVVDDKVVIEARPIGLVHNKYPIEVIEGEVDGYSLFKRSLFDIGRPLNDVLTWLFNSHFYSVRKSLNGEIVYDPSMVSQKDMLSTDPGKRIRLRPQAYGRDIRSMVHVITQGGDVTQNHLRDAQIVQELMQRVMGVNDNLLGSVNPGGRKTATEIRTSSSSAINRMRTMSEYISACGVTPLAGQLLQTTQEMYEGEKKFRIVGDQIDPNDLDRFIEVNPESIAGEYDYVPVDGTLPIDRFATVTMWGQLMQQMKQYPQVAAQYDIAKIFAYVAQQAGLRNIKQFRIQVTGQQGGVPLGLPPGATGGGSGSQSGGGVRGADGQSPVIPLPKQTPGVGPAA